MCTWTVHVGRINKSHLKRILEKIGLKRGPDDVDLFNGVNAILDITENSGQCLVYRNIWKRFITDSGFVIQRTKVMKLMRVIDPNGVKRRKQRRLLRRQYAIPGPNFIWHIDRHDELKPFGFANTWRKWWLLPKNAVAWSWTQQQQPQNIYQIFWETVQLYIMYDFA